MPLHWLPESDLREHCKRSIEALELWLRRLIDQELSTAYGADYINATRPNGDRVLRAEIARRLKERTTDKLKHPRPIDGALLNDLIDILCNPVLYAQHFRGPLQDVFQGPAMARLLLCRLVAPRNALYHANPVSVHDALRILCYSEDVISALKADFQRRGLHQQFNVPTIIRVTDSLGYVAMLSANRPHGAMLDYSTEPAAQLRCGDALSIEVGIDPSFDPGTYDVEWLTSNIGGPVQRGPKFSLNLAERYVSTRLTLVCRVTSKSVWHKLGTIDDQLDIAYRVLPPL